MIVGGMNYGLLLGGGNAAAGPLSGAPAANGGPVVDPLTALKLAQRDEAKEVAREAKDPTVARDVAAFKKGIAGAKDAKAALANPAVLKVLLMANGLGDQLGFPALAQKALMSDPTDPQSLANKLSATNGAWLAAAKTYQFATKGLAALRDPKVQDTLASGYAEVKWRQSLNQRTPGLSNAMQFQSQAASITDVYKVLGDPVNRDVVLTALSIPPQIAYQTLDAQARAVSRRLDLARLKDAHFVQTLTQQYLLNKAQTAAGGDGLAALAKAGGTLA